MRIGAFVTALMLGCLAVAGARVAAAADSPRTLKARDALAKHESTARKLRLEYYSKLADADAQLVRNLDIALRVAAASAGSEEIERINAARAKAQQTLKRDTDEAHGFCTFVIQADAGWQETVELRRGDAVVIQASGTWTSNVHDPKATCGPAGVGGGSPSLGSLIATFKGQKDETALQIGMGHQFVASIDGILELGMRGHAPVGSGLNNGALEVLIKVAPASTR
jgi:hypothetical protein